MKPYFGYALFAILVLMLSIAVPASAQTGTVQGKVKAYEGQSLEGVLVRATSAKNKSVNFETTSNSKGDFEFASLPAGDYFFAFEKKGFKTFTSRNLTVVGGETLKLKNAIELKSEDEPYSSIRGAVLYGVGYTLRNALVKIERIDGGKKFKQEKVSGEGGEFGFRLKAEKATYRITATAKGFQEASTEVEIEGDEVRNVVLTLSKQE
ncbi:MAG: carboxypeptidase-like regulatory domain-containing protein [Blastocatellales bacterium]